jgi:hypothetical protein
MNERIERIMRAAPAIWRYVADLESEGMDRDTLVIVLQADGNLGGMTTQTFAEWRPEDAKILEECPSPHGPSIRVVGINIDFSATVMRLELDPTRPKA